MKKILFVLIACMAMTACKKSEPANYTAALPDDAIALMSIDISGIQTLTGKQTEEIERIKDIAKALDIDQKAYVFVTPEKQVGFLLAVSDEDKLIKNETLDFNEKDGIYWADNILGTLCLHSGRLIMMSNITGSDLRETLSELMSKDTRPEEMLEKVNAREGVIVAYGKGNELVQLAKSVDPKSLRQLPFDPSTHNIYFTLGVNGKECTLQASLVDGDKEDLVKLASNIDEWLPMFIAFSGGTATMEGRRVTLNIDKLASETRDEKQKELFQSMQSLNFDYDDEGNFTLHLVAKSAFDKLAEMFNF